MMIRRSIVLVFFLLSNCTWHAAEQSRPSGDLAAEASYRTVVTVGRCVTPATGESFVGAALLSSVIASVVKRGLDRFGAALKEAGDPRISKVLAARNMEFSNATVGPGSCVQVSRGWMLPSEGGQVSDDPEVATWDDEPKTLPSRFSTAMRSKTGLLWAAKPDFFFEGLITRSGDDSMAMVTPVYAWLGEPLTTELLNPSGQRFATVSLAFQPADGSTPAVTKDGGGTVIDLGRLSTGEGKCFEVLPSLIAPDADADSLKELLGRLGFPQEGGGSCPNDEAAPDAGSGDGITSIPDGGDLPPAGSSAAPAADGPAQPTSDGSDDLQSVAGGGSLPTAATSGGGNRDSVAGEDGASEPAPGQSGGATRQPTALTEADRRTLRTIIVAHPPEQSEFFAFAVGDDSRPFTVRALVTETREANVALQFLAGVFSDVKHTAAETLVSQIDPTRRAEADATARDALDTARNAADKALVEARGAVAACGDAGSDGSEAVAARQKLRALNKAYRDAGVGEPIPQAAINAIPLDGSGIEEGCQTAKKALAKVRPLGAGAAQ